MNSRENWVGEKNQQISFQGYAHTTAVEIRGCQIFYELEENLEDVGPKALKTYLENVDKNFLWQHVTIYYPLRKIYAKSGLFKTSSHTMPYMWFMAGEYRSYPMELQIVYSCLDGMQ
jgi:hypothetical protein